MKTPALDDPFSALDEQPTFIKPNPGGRAPAFASAPAPLQEASVEPGAVPEIGLNPLVAVANRLLLLVPQLRSTRHVADPATLRNALAQGIRDFGTEAAARGIPPERVMAARYVLCTLLDEAASDTPWGGSGVWGRYSLLAMFHNETWGGEKVFQLMAKLAENPAANLDLLELVYAALALGFEGRFRVIDNGAAQLEAVRAKLAQIIRQERVAYAPALAEHWRGVPSRRRVGLGWLPLAASGAVVALVLSAIYLGMTLSLAGASDPVFAQIQNLRLTPPVDTVAPPVAKPRLAQFLAPDIRAGTVAVRDEVDRSVVTVRGDGLFAPASATLLAQHEALMGRIAQALAQVGGAVLVTGHTDDSPIRNARFPSNWHLSEERARSVADLLVQNRVAAQHVRAEGRADGEPVQPNDSPGHRAANRRVEITLFAGRPVNAPAGVR